MTPYAIKLTKLKESFFPFQVVQVDITMYQSIAVVWFLVDFWVWLFSSSFFFIKPFKLLLLCINCCVNETIIYHTSWCLGNQFQFWYTRWIYQFILKSICILLNNSISLNMHAFLHKHSHRKLLVLCFSNDFFCFCVKNLFSLVPTVQNLLRCLLYSKVVKHDFKVSDKKS